MSTANPILAPLPSAEQAPPVPSIDELIRLRWVIDTTALMWSTALRELNAVKADSHRTLKLQRRAELLAELAAVRAEHAHIEALVRHELAVEAREAARAS